MELTKLVIDVPTSILEEMGFFETGSLLMECGDGKITISANEQENECETCEFYCPHCGQCVCDEWDDDDCDDDF